MDDIQKKEMTEEEYADRVIDYLRPHFIFNCLTEIQQLCFEEPEKAEDAVGDFAAYLRGRIDTIKDSAAVSFESELMLLRHYINLERMRYGDKIGISYDIACKDFMIPSMTIVSIVEEMIRQEIRSKPQNCNLSVTTFKKEDSVVVCIGSGAEYNEKASEAVRTAIERLKKQNGSDIEIEENNNKTAVIITIRQQ